MLHFACYRVFPLALGASTARGSRGRGLAAFTALHQAVRAGLRARLGGPPNGLEQRG